MELVNSLVTQLIVMFAYMAIGWVMYRAQLITKEGSKTLAHLLLYAILPCIIIHSFYIPRNAKNTSELLVSLASALVILAAAIVVSRLCFQKSPIDHFGAAFSNAGFMGIPLIAAALGQSAVFYSAGMIALLNIFQWTYGQAVLTGDRRRCSPREALKSPLVISFLVGLLLFFTGIPLPAIAIKCVSSLAGMNAPVAMIILGVYLAQIPFLSLFKDGHAYFSSGIRLVVIPVLTIVLLYPVAQRYAEIGMVLLIAACAPIGSNVAVYAQKLGQDYTYAVKTVCLSTLLAVVSMPAIILLAQYVWHEILP